MIPRDDQASPANPLRVLIIEDTEERQKILTALYRAHAWVLVHTGQRAISLLNAYDFDIISLDYNLDGELTGGDVSRAILNSRNRATRVVVHSLNPRGVAEITDILPQAIYYPVSRMVRNNAAFKRLRAHIDELGTAYEWD